MTISDMKQATKGWEKHYSDIDAEVAKETPCKRCGGKMEYKGYKNTKEKTYKAFMVCYRCNIAEEF